MTWSLAFAIAGVSLAVASFIKYGFGFLTDLLYARVYRQAVDDIIENHFDEIVGTVRDGIVERIEFVRGEQVVKVGGTDSLQETGKSNHQESETDR